MRTEQMIPKTFQARFGAVVRSQRLSAGLSQEELAHRSGLHRTYVTDVERGARNPSLNSIKKLSDALGMPLGGLFGLVEEADRREHQTAASSHQENASPHKPAAILIAAENSSNADTVIRVLSENNIVNNVHVVHDGAEAMDYVFCTGAYKKRDFLETPGLVLLDLRLGKIDAFTILAKIRDNPLTRPIPVVALGAQSDQDLAKARQHGVTEFIVAPFDFPKFALASAQLGFQWTLVSALKRS
jgi:two-component system, response regulator